MPEKEKEYQSKKSHKGIHPKRKFNSTDNLYCVVTGASAAPEHINFVLQYLTQKGYKAYSRKINNKYFIIREFLQEELNDIQFVNSVGEIIQRNGNEYIFNTQGENANVARTTNT